MNDPYSAPGSFPFDFDRLDFFLFLGLAGFFAGAGLGAGFVAGVGAGMAAVFVLVGG